MIEEDRAPNLVAPTRRSGQELAALVRWKTWVDMDKGDETFLMAAHCHR